jgi:hypothetical protein
MTMQSFPDVISQGAQKGEAALFEQQNPFFRGDPYLCKDLFSDLA